MSKPFRAGMFGGKFMPYHKGHLYCLETASRLCDRVYQLLMANCVDEERILRTLSGDELLALSPEQRYARMRAAGRRLGNVETIYMDISQCRTPSGDEDWDAETPLVLRACGHFDAVFGRTLYEALPIIYDMEENGTFGDVIVYSLVTNCDIEEEDIEEIIEHSGGKPTFWITTFGVTNNGNEVLRNVIPRYDNAYLVEWGEIADQHWEWILADGLHLNHEGSVAYADLIRWTITSDLLKPEFAALKFKPITTRK